MSSTNKTTNYDLSQFIGADKPAWLQDYNADMSKIDTQMKANADSATAANGAASATSTNLGDISTLETTNKSSAVSAINEVNTKATSAQGLADTAQSTASSALSAATGANNDISALQSYLDLSVNNSYSGSRFSVTSGTGTVSSASTLYVARNAAGTLCKIYGTIDMSGSTDNSRTTIKLNADTGLRPDSAMTLVGTGFISAANATSNVDTNLNLTINADGTIELEGYHETGTFYYRAIACLIFVKNFGDQPE